MRTESGRAFGSPRPLIMFPHPGSRTRLAIIVALLQLRELDGDLGAELWLRRRVCAWDCCWYALPPTIHGRHVALLRAITSHLARLKGYTGAARRRHLSGGWS